MRFLVVLVLLCSHSFAQESSITGKWLLTELSAPDSLRSNDFEKFMSEKRFWIWFLDSPIVKTPQISISTPCNHGGSHYELEGNRISIGSITKTLKGCPGKRGAAEDYWFKVISQSFIINFKDNGFIFKSANGLYWLTFVMMKE